MESSEPSHSHLRTALGVKIDTVAPNERGEVVVTLYSELRPDEPFEAWLTPTEARDLAGQLEAQASRCS